jgi:hypothetical protein
LTSICIANLKIFLKNISFLIIKNIFKDIFNFYSQNANKNLIVKIPYKFSTPVFLAPITASSFQPSQPTMAATSTPSPGPGKTGSPQKPETGKTAGGTQQQQQMLNRFKV